MKKTLFLIISILILVIIIIISVFASSQGKKNQQKNIAIPSPIPVETTTPLHIVSSDPQEKQQGVPTNQIITLTFNRSIAQEDLSFSIEPKTDFTTTTANKQFIITFTSTLSPNTPYTYMIKSHSISLASFTFTTADKNSANIHDTFSQSLAIWSRANEPDLFVHNRSPYATSDFSVTSDMTQAAPYHFYSTVALLGQDKNQSKQAFINWLLALGLTQEQIQTLDIRYR